MKNLWFIIALSVMCLPLQLISQSSYLGLHSNSEQLMQRYETRIGRFSNELHSAIKPFNRKALSGWMTEQQNHFPSKSKSDDFNYQYLRSDNIPWSDAALYDSRKPLLKHFYRSKANLFQVHEKDFDLVINPGLYLLAASSNLDNNLLTINSRAVELYGSIGQKVGFYAFVSENQLFAARHERDFRSSWGSYPGAHLTKGFKEGGVDFIQARGYITFSPIPAISMQFGQDRNFIGQGTRSLLLSDFATDYPFLKINTKVWKLNYMNLFARLTDRYGYVTGTGNTRPYPAKYIALHYLSINIFPRLNAGLFESVTFHDNNGNGRGFDISYLNPIIFYRSVEHQLGDPDKMMVGATLAWLPVKNIKLHGQFMLNEFRFADLIEGNGHHANKFGYQIAADYTNIFGLNNFDIQVEYNRIRPYAYAHYTVGTNDSYAVNSYSHYNQPLAHPLGANLSEFICTLNTQPFPRLIGKLSLIMADYGADSSGSNWGGNIFLDYRDYEQELGNTVGQGVATKLLLAQALLSYQLRHNLFIEVDIRYRSLRSDISPRNSNNSFVGGALRYNLPHRPWTF